MQRSDSYLIGLCLILGICLIALAGIALEAIILVVVLLGLLVAALSMRTWWP
jgi:hypothetical protein